MRYVFSVRTYRDDCRGTSCGGSEESLSDALRQATREASYYKHVCEYPRVTIEIETVCEKCDGTGFTGKRTQRKCTKCDWGTIPLIPEFEYELHPNVVETLVS